MAGKKKTKGIKWDGCYYSTGSVAKVEGAKQKDGKKPYTAYLKYKDESGKWHNKQHTIWASSDKDAHSQLCSWHEDEEAKVNPTADDTETVSQYVNRYIETSEKTHRVERSTIAFYRAQEKKIQDGLGNVPLDNLNADMVEEWVANLMSGDKSLTATTAGKALKFLKSVTAHAELTERLDRDPLRRVKPPKFSRKEPNALDKQGRERLLAYLDALPDSELNIAIRLALLTGMRVGEICGLTWRNADLDKGELSIVQAIGRTENGTYIKDTKTGCSHRRIPIPEELTTRLKSWKEHQQAQLDSMSVPFDSGMFVVGTIDPSGFKYANPTLLSKAWRVVSKQLALKGTQGDSVTFHDLRHTFATTAISEGADVKSVSSILGHANAAMTLNVYASADPISMRQTVEAVANSMQMQQTD